ncbi:Uma2 family endonuclease [Phormidium pseudopriestleyi FRX01]|uniref:Uma2 family endonuclease n=1 Tax=Phormidium pseudopriestleyi FRX01 TaxID=1759528 RepID=A0ABS3FPV2_9CYAN|nr:Uma2 family endonuclease [Phormidium pseudopriestleyi]MBO0348387.1 Uma2 family endonuclease [Phormidium pseudopriestleyi FRX01]
MTLITGIVKPVSEIKLEPGSTVTIPNISWQEFEKLLEELGEKRSSRIAYSHNTLQIMVSLPEHEITRDLISDIVKTLLKVKVTRYEPFGSTTFKREGMAGIEPDASFYIQNCQRMIGRRRLQPDDPPPDLAIETDVTSKTTIEAYKAIECPEVWVYNKSKLTIYLLEEGEYVTAENSPIFPEVAIAQIITTVVERAWQVGTYQALAEFEAAIA